MRFFDTHCHLDDEQFEPIREDVVARAVEAGVRDMLAVGVTADSSQACIALAATYEPVLAAVGIQPNYCAEAKPGDWERIVELSEDAHVAALGETGLDRYWDHSPFELQQDYFDRHIRLSQQTQLPFVVHLRDCEEDILQMLREARSRGPLSGIMHSFTGTAAGAAECVELGLHISFAGMVTYNKSTELRSIAATIPSDRILIETDAPYLSPHPKRGQRPNEPSLVIHTAECLAETRGVALLEFTQTTTLNAQRLLKRRG